MVAQMERTGVSSLGIVGLSPSSSALVMTYIGAQQLRPYGAEIFTVNLLAVGFLRELAGCWRRSSSPAARQRLTAEIGAMW